MSSLQSSAQQGLLRPLRKLGLTIAAQWPFAVRCRTQSGRSMFVDLRSAVGRAIFMRGEFDPGFFRPFETILRRGDVSLDVGANVGYYSMLALNLVGKGGVVHAFEIDSRPLRCLRKTIGTERIRNLHLHEVAVGNQVGRAVLIRESDCGNSHIATLDDRSGIIVEITTLDAWYIERGRPRISAIILDIEGAEPEALLGAQQTLTEQWPSIVCEAWDGEDPIRSEAAMLLHKLGYSIEALCDINSPAIFAQPPGSP